MIHNFYSHDSTFIHGTIEMASQQQSGPAVGRDQIEGKIKGLKLNDCRAKIEQIDCLETLAGGLVIQVIGELSNNGKPMRRFLQTFVLAPSTKDQATGRSGDLISNSQNSPPQGDSAPKFYVLNSIFRYQDDGPDGELGEDNISARANLTTDNNSAAPGLRAKHDENNGGDHLRMNQLQPYSSTNSRHQSQGTLNHHHRAEPVVAASQVEPAVRQQQQQHQQQHQQAPPLRHNQLHSVADPVSQEHKRTENAALNHKITPTNVQNSGSGNAGEGDRMYDAPEVSAEKSKSVVCDGDNEQAKKTPASNAPVPPSQSSSAATPSAVTSSSANAPVAQAPVPRPIEPKTWANIISRNANPSSPHSVPNTATPAAPRSTSNDQQNQTNQQAAQAAQMGQPNSQNHQQQDQASHDQAQQAHQMQPVQHMDMGPRGPINSSNLNMNMSMGVNMNMNNNNNQNRRRNMIRKPSNKPPGGRQMKDRPRPPPPPPAQAQTQAGRPVV